MRTAPVHPSSSESHHSCSLHLVPLVRGHSCAPPCVPPARPPADPRPSARTHGLHRASPVCPLPGAQHPSSPARLSPPHLCLHLCLPPSLSLSISLSPSQSLHLYLSPCFMVSLSLFPRLLFQEFYLLQKQRYNSITGSVQGRGVCSGPHGGCRVAALLLPVVSRPRPAAPQVMWTQGGAASPPHRVPILHPDASLSPSSCDGHTPV